MEHGFGDFTTIYAVISSNLNPIFNILVIVSRQKDIAKAVQKVFADWSYRRNGKVFAARHELPSALRNPADTSILKSNSAAKQPY